MYVRVRACIYGYTYLRSGVNVNIIQFDDEHFLVSATTISKQAIDSPSIFTRRVLSKIHNFFTVIR